ncbi:MAG TPA: exodeoxyribonuclease VII large subunit [Bacteroidota bacterium]|nr:exodeoxyribonuclease VII large subunit [Bacteroidota bacterium]
MNSQPQRDGKILTVSELTRMIKGSLEESFPHVWLQGEISNFKRHTSGHLYFTLKDEGAQISGVMWRSRAENLLFSPEDGMEVQARGAITVYPPRGNYQIDVVRMLPVGIGELQLAFEQLKRKLEAEGLFDPAKKKPIPEFPHAIGVITSPTGAALQDIRSVLERRQPSVEVVVLPVRVQGPGAAEEIAVAIREMNQYGDIDVLIIGRGGGSLEDLWAFNEEVVARAIYQSSIPVISAVGHEIDFSISDFVADLRAPTPSAAAEMAVRDRAEILDILGNYCYSMKQNLTERVKTFRDRVGSLVASYSFNRPKDLLLQYSQRIDEIERSLTSVTARMLERSQGELATLTQTLEALGPRNVLKRGYVIVMKDGKTIMWARGLEEGDKTELRFHDGSRKARIEGE